MKFKNKPQGKFRSKLEMQFAEALDAAGVSYQYEMLRILLVDASEVLLVENGKITKTKTKPVYYVPDFVGKDWVVEVKGRMTPDGAIKVKLATFYFAKKGIRYYLIRSKKDIAVIINELL